MSFLYQIGIYGYFLLIKAASLFNEKARLWINGRKNLFRKMSQVIDNNTNIVWFHAASLGEFEQGRPVIEAFRRHFPDKKILLTFYSPSGYEIRKNYKGADYIFYLPLDTRQNAKRFIETVKPEMAVFIKYEFWFNFLNVLNNNKIPVIVISAIFRKEQHFFKWYGGWFAKQLKTVSKFYVQNGESEKLLKSIGIENVVVSGDTRFDRVYEIADNAKDFPVIEKFVKNRKVFLAGSTWPPDEAIINELARKNRGMWKFIIAPHETHKDRIAMITKMFSGFKTIRFSQIQTEDISGYDVLIIDGIGFLSSLYKYCYVAYIGGGFGKGIHNILEAATFGKPVIFGPSYAKFSEAKDLVALKGAFSVGDASGLVKITSELYNDNSFYQNSSTVCKQYVEEKRGATQIIMKGISQLLR